MIYALVLGEIQSCIGLLVFVQTDDARDAIAKVYSARQNQIDFYLKQILQMEL